MIDHTKRMLISSLGVLTLTGVALADDTTSGQSGLETMEQPVVEHIVQVAPGVSYISDADFHSAALGSVSVWRLDIPASYTIKLEPGDLRLGAFYEYSEYDTDRLAGSQDFNTLRFNALWKAMIDDTWGYFLYGGVSLSSSTETGLDRGLTGVGGGGVQYVWSEDLRLGLGLAVATQLEDDPRVLPIIALNWQIDDRWNLRTLNGATISYDVSGDKTFLADFGVNYQHREYRLQRETSLTDQMVALELGATYRFNPQFAVRGFLGVAAGRNFEIWHSGNKLVDQDVDPSPFLGVRALFTF
jgi:Domain of unknown function (DUF6268)